MQKYFYFILFLFASGLAVAQNDDLRIDTKRDTIKKSLRIDHSKDKPKAKYEQYRIVTLERDTLYIDSSLTINSLYRHNYLRKDHFGLLPFTNEGQTYNTLNFGLKNLSSPLPEMGFKAKHFNFYEAKKINYYSVATPFTELYYKSVMEQGQTLSTTITVNTSERLNFSFGFKGLRSIGKYINQLSSSGNVVFTTNYSTKKQQYVAYAHFTGQDILNGENGGISNISDFESDNPDFEDRARVAVVLKDATSFLKGRRYFLDHCFRINGTAKNNNIYILHQINYENKFFDYNQQTVNLSTDPKLFYSVFGNSYLGANLLDVTRYNKLYNKVGLAFDNVKLGKIQVFAEDFRNNSYYNKVLFLGGNTIPSALSHKIQTIGGQYDFKKEKWNGRFEFSKAISVQTNSNILAKLQYNLSDENQITAEIQNISKLPNNNYLLNQSNFVSYNWSNNFNNENSSNLKIDATTRWIDASLQLSSLKNHLYFSNDDATGMQLISPKQYGSAINYASLKLNKEVSLGKFSLDNTLLLQEVSQAEKIINVPGIVTRNSVYFTDYFLKKNLYLQTGVTLNYFTKYYSDSYNPVIGEFFIQKDKKIGGYANLDFFVNARIRQTRIFLIAEHFNSSFSGRNYLSAPNYPYRDFMIRFGINWNFFQ